jgi:hypothetical protein
MILFCENAKQLKLRQRRQKPVMVIGNFFHSGPESDPLPPGKFGRFPIAFREAFQDTYQTVVARLAVIDSVIPEKKWIEASQRDRALRFAELPRIPDSLKMRPAIALVGTYLYSEKDGVLKIFCRLAEPKDGTVFLTERAELHMKEAGDSTNVKKFAHEVAVKLEDAISRALILEEILKSPLVWDPEKLKAPIVRDISFGVERSPALDALPLGMINQVQIKEPYWRKDSKSLGPNLFLQRLRDQVIQYYPAKTLITGTEPPANDSALVLFGEIITNSPLQLENFMTYRARNLPKPLTLAKLRLEFLRSGQDITPLDVERAVDILMLNLEALIPRRPIVENRGKPEKMTSDTIQKISKWQSLPSLLFAGTSQLIIAERFEVSSIKPQKRWGLFFLATEAALLGSAIYFDQQAVRNLDNKDLRTRNGLLIGAGGLGVISAAKAWVDIGRHNKGK